MKRYVPFLLFFVALTQIQGQDLHFTQFYSNPMFLNSANAGNFNGDYRVGLNAKSQWASVADAYRTVALHGDFSIVPDGASSKNWIGIGATLFVDSEGGGVLQTIEAKGHIAFHKHISNNFYLSLGGGFGYTNKSLDFAKITFGSQWNGTEFNGAIPSMENFETNQIGYLDVSSGVSFSYFLDKTLRVNWGFAVHHINEPTESFFFIDNTRESNRREVRPVAHVDAEIFLDYISIMPAAYYTRTKGAQELILGSNVSYDLDNAAVIGGLWYRQTGTAALLAGVQINSNRVLVSYDFDIGAVRDLSDFRNGFEVSFIRVGGIRKSKSRLYCPRF